MSVDTKRCPVCSKDKPLSEFHSRFKNGKVVPSSYCKPCLYAYQHRRWIERKRWIIGLLGGHCIVCGYSKCLSGFDLHHRDPSEKDACWDVVQKWSKDRILKEVAKCDLMCCRCHRELHHPEEVVPSE